MKIYTVFGTTCEYSDKIIWPVVSYYDEKLAQKHVVNAIEKANEWQIMRLNTYENPPDEFSIYDPKLKMDYTGTSYYYVTTDIIDSI
jgi:hypothetical protein